MIEDPTDDRLDALVRQQRPDSVRTTKAWRHSQRHALLAHIHDVDEAEQDAIDPGSTSPPRSLHFGASNRRWGWAAAAVLVTGGIAALASLPGNGPQVATPAGSTQAGSVPSNDSIDASSPPTPRMIIPGLAVSPQVGRLLSLPTCDTDDGLAEWTTDQLKWWRDLDPADAQAASFSQVTASVAVDTAATSATCSIAIAIDDALAWGLGDGNGNWVARATGVPNAEDYAWPESNRDRNGDDGTGGQFGTGQFFNDFNVQTTDLEPIAAGALSSSTKSGQSPIYIVDFADELPLDAEPSRLWYLRTTAPELDETVGGPPEPSLTPTLVPAGFGQCSVGYIRQNSAGQFAFAIDYCDTTSTITVTAGTVVDGDAIVVNDVDIVVGRNGDSVRVGFATDGPVVIGPPEVSVDALAATLTSIPAARTELPADRTGSADFAPSGAMVPDQLPAALANASGYSYVGTPEASEPPGPVDAWIQRWYTTTMVQPEVHPRLKLASTSATQQFPPEIPPRGVDADQVTVQDAPGWVYDDPTSSGRTVAFRDDETVFVLTGYQLSDDEILTAAQDTMLADSNSVGAVINSGALPTDLVERAVGTTAEDPFLPLESSQHPPTSIRWYNARPDGALPGDGEPMLWLGWRLEDPDLFPLHRLDHDSVTDTTVHGVPAFIADDAPGYIGIFWSEGGFTYTIRGFALDQDTVLEAANQLRPATDADWAALEPEPG